MKHAIHDYLAYMQSAGRSKKTLLEYSSRLRYFREFAQSHHIRSIRRVTISLIRAYHDDLISRDLKINSQWLYLQTLRYFLQWLYRKGKILTDLAESIDMPTLEDTLPPKPLTHDDMKTLFALVSRGRSVSALRNRAVMEVLYGCGLRKDELLGLNIGDVDGSAGTLLIRGKGNKERLLPVNEISLEAIAAYLVARKGKPQKKSPLFLTHDLSDSRPRRMTANGLCNLLKRLSKALGKHLHPHLFRHTYAVHMLQGGADIRHVQILLGHESPDTTSRYLGLCRDDLKAEYDRVMERIGNPCQTQNEW